MRIACLLLILSWCAGCATHPRPGPVATVPVYYATTRAIATNASTPEKAFSNTTAEHRYVRYGRALVEVTPSGQHILSYDPPVRADDPGLLPGKFDSEVRSEINSARPLIVYIHGYNNTFAAAANRAALFAHELQPDAAKSPAIYSWPSASKLLAYAKDEETALLNQENIRRFLDGLHGTDATSPIVLIGHSLGARALTYGLRDIFLFRAGARKVDPRRPIFAQLILLEPDVNRLYFRQNIVRARALCGHVTVYASSRDRALGLSQFLHDYPRLGELPGRNLAEKIDVIDASAVRSDFFGHSYDKPVLFEDIRALLQGKSMPEREHHSLEKDPASGLYRLLATPQA